MQELFVVHQGIGVELTITGITHPGQYIAILGHFLIHRSYRHVHIRVGFHDLVQSLLAPNHTHDVNFFDAPLKNVRTRYSGR